MRVLYSPIGPSLDLEHVPTSYSFFITSSSSFDFVFLFFLSLSFSLSLSLGTYLGSGQFGEVYKGMWLGPKGNLDAAIKTLREDASKEDKVRFLQEAAIIGQFSHPNVVGGRQGQRGEDTIVGQVMLNTRKIKFLNEMKQ